MAAFFDVRLAVIIMVTPNLVTNIWQLRQYWADRRGDATGVMLDDVWAGVFAAILGAILAALAHGVMA